MITISPAAIPANSGINHRIRGFARMTIVVVGCFALVGASFRYIRAQGRSSPPADTTAEGYPAGVASTRRICYSIF